MNDDRRRWSRLRKVALSPVRGTPLGLLALLAAGATLAGCSQPGADAAADGPPALAAGKGAIAGLLVDDRYRPLHLTDAPQADYEAEGFILVVETGATVTSDVTGEFTVHDPIGDNCH